MSLESEKLIEQVVPGDGAKSKKARPDGSDVPVECGPTRIKSAVPRSTTAARVEPELLPPDCQLDLRTAHEALSRGWADLQLINRLLTQRGDSADNLNLGQLLVRESRLDDQQLEELMARVFEIGSVSEALSNPPRLAVHRDGRRLFLVDLSSPRMLGKYQLLERIGSGGMGMVHRAYDPALERSVALKMIRPLPGEDQTDIARFRREARMAARLEHPNIVRVWDVGRDDGIEYIAMDLVDGCTLDSYLARNELDVLQRLRLVQQVAAALGHAHRHGIIHRDIKPSNILVTRDGQPAVVDFGLARPIQDTDGLTQTDAWLGTPRYMAPEQIAGAPDNGPPADVYALGAVLHEVLTGELMNPGQNLAEIFEWTRETIPGPLEIDGVKASREIQTIFARCVEKDPSRRYRDGDALAAELGRHLAGESIQARPQGRWRRFLYRLRTFLRPAGRAGLLAVLCALTPWMSYKLAEWSGLVSPLVALQITCDVMAVVIGGLVYLALRRKARLEERQVPLLRQLDAANRDLKRARERLDEFDDIGTELRAQLLPYHAAISAGTIEVGWIVDPHPAAPQAAITFRVLSPGARFGFLLLHARGSAERLTMLSVAQAVWRYGAVPEELVADPVALARWFVREALPGPLPFDLVCGTVTAPGQLRFALIGDAAPPILQRRDGSLESASAEGDELREGAVELLEQDGVFVFVGRVPTPAGVPLQALCGERSESTAQRRLGGLADRLGRPAPDDATAADWAGVALLRHVTLPDQTTLVRPDR